MKKMKEQSKIIGRRICEFLRLALLIGMLVLIFLVAPRLTEITKDIVKFLYELEEEYITRFWTILLALVSTITVFFGNNKRIEKRG